MNPTVQVSRKSEEVPVFTAAGKGRFRTESTPKAVARAWGSEIVGWIRILAAFDIAFVAFGVWVSRFLLSEV